MTDFENDRTTGVPHSGSPNIPETMRDGHPTGEFDNTELTEFDTSHLTAPKDPATLPEYMPSVAETVAPPFEHQYRELPLQETTKNKPWLKPLAILGIAGVGAGIFAITSGGNEDKEKTANELPSTTLPQGEVENPEPPTTVVEVRTADELLPVFMTSDDPETLIEEYAHNQNCTYNSLTPEEQLTCATYYVGNMKFAGELGVSITGILDQLNDLRETDPSLQMNITVEYLSHRFISDTELLVAIKESDHTGDFYRLVELDKSDPLAEGITGDDAPATAWFVSNKDPISEATARSGDF